MDQIHHRHELFPAHKTYCNPTRLPETRLYKHPGLLRLAVKAQAYLVSHFTLKEEGVQMISSLNKYMNNAVS